MSDWTSPQNDALWRDGVKTLFDPCPAGWRVPTSGRSPWRAFTVHNGPLQGTDSDRGRLFDQTVVQSATAWYPLSGRRNYDSGNPVKETGYCYASTALSHKAYYLGIYLTYINAWAGESLNGRAEGFPVRCVRE